jgi:hypothetical protein
MADSGVGMKATPQAQLRFLVRMLDPGARDARPPGAGLAMH